MSGIPKSIYEFLALCRKTHFYRSIQLTRQNLQQLFVVVGSAAVFLLFLLRFLFLCLTLPLFNHFHSSLFSSIDWFGFLFFNDGETLILTVQRDCRGFDISYGGGFLQIQTVCVFWSELMRGDACFLRVQFFFSEVFDDVKTGISCAESVTDLLSAVFSAIRAIDKFLFPTYFSIALQRASAS